jgi:undecaprenyl-diphosphatase
MVKIRSGYFFAILGSFAILGMLVGLGITSAPDDSVVRYFHSLEGNASLDLAMVAISTLGDATFLVILGIVLTVIRRTRKVGMVFLIAIVVVAILTMYIKPLVGREIPPYSFEPAIKLPKGTIEVDSLAPFAANFSFPAGHAARATALAFMAGFAIYKKNRELAYLLWSFPLIIGVTRIYLMQQYPTDIAGGILFGLLVAISLSSIMKLEQPFNISRFKTTANDSVGPAS